MKSWQKATLVALIHVALVSSIGAKLLYDRATRPRVWIKAETYDPNLPIRGRYVSLQLRFDDPAPRPEPPSPPNKPPVYVPYYDRSDFGRISVVDGKAFVTICKDQNEPGCLRFNHWERVRGEKVIVLQDPVLYFIPDTAANPSVLKPGEELWVEVTIPHKGPPRPIQLALKSNGVWKPLNLN